MRHAGWVVSVALVGAGCGAGTTPATPDAGGSVDVTVAMDVAVDRPDVPDVQIVEEGPAPDVTPFEENLLPIDHPVAACAIEGASPQALHLHGEGLSYPDAGPPQALRQDLDLYLPMGRVAGAPVILAFPTTWPANGLTTVRGTFGADLGVAGLDWTSPYGGALSFAGRMAAPSGNLTMHLSGNLNGVTDTIEFAEGDLSLCPTGAAAAPTLRSDHAVTPRGTVDLVPSAPVAGDVGVVRLLVGGAAVPADVTASGGVITVTARAWLAPGTAVTVDPNGLHDVMGRAFTIDGAVTALATTDVVIDREFTAAPPAGAVASDNGAVVRDGALYIGEGERRPYRALLALGPLTGATTLRAQLRFRCEDPSLVSFWIVAADGTHTALPVPSMAAGDAGYGDRALSGALPATGPTWLLAESRAVRTMPGWLPLIACSFAIDRIAAE